mmetsp:Transcript_21187/g.50205  ORF Transcript_21187/g.50205 Transcript_21187/m.50205 type:complete len:249 (-) Transcript_21187:43-789(-)
MHRGCERAELAVECVEQAAGLRLALAVAQESVDEHAEVVLRAEHELAEHGTHLAALAGEEAQRAERTRPVRGVGAAPAQLERAEAAELQGPRAVERVRGGQQRRLWLELEAELRQLCERAVGLGSRRRRRCDDGQVLLEQAVRVARVQPVRAAVRRAHAFDAARHSSEEIRPYEHRARRGKVLRAQERCDHPPRVQVRRRRLGPLPRLAQAEDRVGPRVPVAQNDVHAPLPEVLPVGRVRRRERGRHA